VNASPEETVTMVASGTTLQKASPVVGQQRLAESRG
jgi:hypothetical protein